jgi:hypothetical protein
MDMWRRVSVCLVLIAVAASPALAAESAGADLFRRCTSTAAAAADAACANYVYGVLNQLPSGQAAVALRRNTCFPKVVTPSQVDAIVENYLRNHPERLSAGAATVRAEAFNSVFPCKPN